MVNVLGPPKTTDDPAFDGMATEMENFGEKMPVPMGPTMPDQDVVTDKADDEVPEDERVLPTLKERERARKAAIRDELRSKGIPSSFAPGYQSSSSEEEEAGEDESFYSYKEAHDSNNGKDCFMCCYARGDLPNELYVAFNSMMPTFMQDLNITPLAELAAGIDRHYHAIVAPTYLKLIQSFNDQAAIAEFKRLPKMTVPIVLGHLQGLPAEQIRLKQEEEQCRELADLAFTQIRHSLVTYKVNRRGERLQNRVDYGAVKVWKELVQLRHSLSRMDPLKSRNYVPYLPNNVVDNFTNRRQTILGPLPRTVSQEELELRQMLTKDMMTRYRNGQPPNGADPGPASGPGNGGNGRKKKRERATVRPTNNNTGSMGPPAPKRPKIYESVPSHFSDSMEEPEPVAPGMVTSLLPPDDDSR